jgi:nucleotide-binding universal stress UspA family protein
MKAIIGTDGSSCAQVALELAESLPWPHGSTLRVVSAFDPMSFYGPFVAFAPEVGDLEGDLDAELERRVKDSASRLAAPGRVTEHRTEFGRPSTVLCDEARALGADLIMVGSRGHGSFASMLLGSVSAEVIDHAARPVLVARGRIAQHIVLALDGSENGYAAETVVRTWPIFAGTRVDVVSVAESVQNWDGLLAAEVTVPTDWRSPATGESRRQHGELAATAARRLADAGHVTETIVPAGDPARELTRIAEQHGADLIVMGTRGNTGLRRLVLGSVARNVLLHAHCSVLVVPQPH